MSKKILCKRWEDFKKGRVFNWLDKISYIKFFLTLKPRLFYDICACVVIFSSSCFVAVETGYFILSTFDYLRSVWKTSVNKYNENSMFWYMSKNFLLNFNLIYHKRYPCNTRSTYSLIYYKLLQINPLFLMGKFFLYTSVL